jgi:hypothetical protein
METSKWLKKDGVHTSSLGLDGLAHEFPVKLDLGLPCMNHLELPHTSPMIQTLINFMD